VIQKCAGGATGGFGGAPPPRFFYTVNFAAVGRRNHFTLVLQEHRRYPALLQDSSRAQAQAALLLM